MADTIESLRDENTRLRRRVEELERCQQLDLAAQIQYQLVPRESPNIRGFEVAGASVIATPPGGDYYDFIPLTRNRLVVAVGDVSGKGLAASLMMAHVHSTVRAQTLMHDEPATCVNRANQLLFRSTPPGKFVTLFFGVLDPERNRLDYCNAGHTAPMFFSAGQMPRALRTGGVVLGILEDAKHTGETLEFRQGDLLLIYSDGVTEIADAYEHPFGLDRLARIVDAHRAKPAQTLVDEIVSTVRFYAGNTPLPDDMTLVVIKRLQSV